MKISTLGRINLAFVIACLILIFVGWTAINNIQQLISSAKWVDHTQQVQQRIQTIVGSATDMETSQRGYMLTGNPEYLELFELAQQEMPQEFVGLRGLVKDNPEQQANIAAFEDLLKKRLDFAKQMIELRRSQGFEAAVKQMNLSNHRGLRLTNDIRAYAQKVLNIEQMLLAERRQTNETDAASAIRVLIVGIVIAMVLVIGSGWLVTRYLLAKEKAEAQLKAVFNSRDAAESLARDSAQMSAVSSQLANSANESSRQMQSASAASSEVNWSVQQVATAIEEMGASIREISGNAGEAARIARNGVKVAGDTHHTIQDLRDSSVEMGKVINLITTVAQQTKLLALNATIEAARAGAAGKGFAVVANEVKDLAKETAQASEEISERIQAIQVVSQNTIQALSEITTIIEQIADLQGMIASAVEEQSMVTHEINHNVKAVARSSEAINTNINNVVTSAAETAGGATLVQQTSSNLAQLAGQLRSLIEITGA